MDPEPMIDEVNRKIIMHLKSHSETDVGVYENEYVWIISTSEDGTEIVDVVEFADSQYTTEWGAKLQQAVKEKETA